MPGDLWGTLEFPRGMGNVQLLPPTRPVVDVVDVTLPRVRITSPTLPRSPEPLLNLLDQHSQALDQPRQSPQGVVCRCLLSALFLAATEDGQPG